MTRYPSRHKNLSLLEPPEELSGMLHTHQQNQLPNSPVTTQSTRTTGVNNTFSSTAESISQPTLHCPCLWAHVIVENMGFLQLTLTCCVDCWRVLQSRARGPPRRRTQTYKGQGSKDENSSHGGRSSAWEGRGCTATFHNFLITFLTQGKLDERDF